jgi:hypothetical protein
MTTQVLAECLESLEDSPAKSLDLLFELSRDPVARQEVQSRAIPKLIDLFNKYYPSRNESSDTTAMLQKILRVMRNLCGNFSETPIAIRNAHVLECTYQMLEEYTNKSSLNEHDYLLLRTIITLHSNVVISSAEIRREIWERAVNSELYLRTTHLSHSPLNAHIAMCLLNCIANDAELRAQLSLDTPATHLFMKLLDLAAQESSEDENVNTSVFYWT